MAQLAPWAGLFAVIMKCQSIDCQQAVPIRHFTEKIDHRRVTQSPGAAERQVAYGAKMVFELAGDAAFDAPMSRVVDSRRHLIGNQAPFHHEKFNGKYSDVAERVHEPL